MHSFKDITDRERLEADLRIAAAAFEASVGIMVTDTNSVILRVNRAFSEVTGYSLEELQGQTPRILKSGRHDAAFYAEMWECIHRTRNWEGEIWDRRKNGEIYPKWMSITAITDEGGKVTHYVATQTDITERKAAEVEIRQLAFFDPLTNLPGTRTSANEFAPTNLTAGKFRMKQSSTVSCATEMVNMHNCQISRIGAYIEVCMVKTSCIYADDYPPLRLCAHPLRNQINNEDGFPLQPRKTAHE